MYFLIQTYSIKKPHYLFITSYKYDKPYFFLLPLWDSVLLTNNRLLVSMSPTRGVGGSGSFLRLTQERPGTDEAAAFRGQCLRWWRQKESIGLEMKPVWWKERKKKRPFLSIKVFHFIFSAQSFNESFQDQNYSHWPDLKTLMHSKLFSHVSVFY